MKRMVETIPFLRLRDLEVLKDVKFEDKAVCWDSSGRKAGSHAVADYSGQYFIFSEELNV